MSRHTGRRICHGRPRGCSAANDTTTPNGNNSSFNPLPVRSQITGQAGGADGKVP